MYGGASIELMVRNGNLSLVDYGWSTSHGWQCGPGYIDEVHRGQNRWLAVWGTADVAVLHLLSQYEALRDDFGHEGPSFCGASSVTRKGSTYTRLRRSAEHRQLDGTSGGPLPSECFNGTSGYFDIAGGSGSLFTDPGDPGNGVGSGPLLYNLIRGFGSHLRQCHALCQSCPRCFAFAPSKTTGKCHWSSTCNPMNGSQPAWNGAHAPTFSRTLNTVASRPPPPKPSAALQAIMDAPAGHCGDTDTHTGVLAHLGKINACKKANGKGSWHLREMVGGLTDTGPLAADGLTPDIVARCKAACAACSACAFFSINLYADTCSWYRSCDLTALTPTPLGYRTFTMPGQEQWHHQGVGSAAASEALFNAAYDSRQNRQLLNVVPF